MPARVLLCLLAVGLAAGCQSPPATRENATASPKLDKRRSVEITPADEEFIARRSAVRPADLRKQRSRAVVDELTEGEVYELPKFTVTERGFSKFGLSVVTNTEVVHDGLIEWMRIGVVLPGSPAAQQGLFTGMEILAIDGTPIARLDRAGMLQALFERKSGEQVRLLVYSRHFSPLPRFVVLGGPVRTSR
jgi:membrane-associated protease RseP (regulator of RpoE activity)